MTPAVQPSGLQSQGQPPAQFPSPPVQVSQWLASPGVAPQFTPYHTGFSPEQTSSLFVPESSVSRSLGASFSELTGMPTPPHMHAAGPSTAAPAIMTTQRLPSSVASSDPTTDMLAASQAAPAQLRPRPLQRHFLLQRVSQFKAQGQTMMAPSSILLHVLQRPTRPL